MSKGLFDLTKLESMGDDDIIAMNINENSEFAHKNPDTNHPEEHFDKDATGAKENSVSVPGGISETPKAKPYDASSVSIPEGGDKETPKAKPYDASSISIPSKVTLTSDQYNAALASLKKSFKECVDVIEVLENANVVEQTIDDKQEAYIESVLGDQLLTAYEDGPVFEAVKRADKDDVKSIVRSLRSKIEDDLHDQKIKFYKPNLVARAIAGLALPLEAAAIRQIWSMRLWQVIGICLIEEGNVKDLTDSLTKKYSEELGNYKVLYALASPTIIDYFRVKFGWKNDKNCYFLLIDKKIPKELGEFEKKMEDGIDNKDDKKED